MEWDRNDMGVYTNIGDGNKHRIMETQYTQRKVGWKVHGGCTQTEGLEINKG